MNLRRLVQDNQSGSMNTACMQERHSNVLSASRFSFSGLCTTKSPHKPIQTNAQCAIRLCYRCKAGEVLKKQNAYEDDDPTVSSPQNFVCKAAQIWTSPLYDDRDGHDTSHYWNSGKYGKWNMHHSIPPCACWHIKMSKLDIGPSNVKCKKHARPESCGMPQTVATLRLVTKLAYLTYRTSPLIQ